MGASQSGAAVWEGPVIPFEIDPHFSNPARILQAIRDHWEEQTNIRFVRRAGQGHYVLFRHGQEWQSPVFPQSGMHPVTCTPDASVADITHEIGHALGFVHEHQRSDRDDVVDVQEDNIRRGKEGNFRRIVNSINYTDYDPRSIMHYDTVQFSADERGSRAHPRQRTHGKTDRRSVSCQSGER